MINLGGWSTLTLRFKYIENGSGAADNALLDYYDGATWTQLADMPKTPVGSCGVQGTWTSYSIALPASANNNPNVRIGFRWVNDDDGVGSDPSVAIDDVEILVPYVPPGTGLVVNELSNGPSGNKEYIELAAVGPTCTIDIRGIKVDDNNGVANNGFGSLMNGSGVSIGHNRFSNAAQWAIVPTGSLILIYNGADLNASVPAMDPSDLAPHDSIYILPATSVLLNGCGNFPDGLVTANYPACTYGAGSWTWMGYRDQGDAGQTRDPNGRYFHGISYGPGLQNMNNGGLDNLRITTASAAASVLWFNSGNFRLAANFGFGAVAGNETPGAPNNLANLLWLRGIRCFALPVELVAFSVENLSDRVRLRWATATEHNSDHFTVDRSDDDLFFAPIAHLPAAGDSQHRVDYVHDDPDPRPGVSYYRLREIDNDGAETTSAAVAVVRHTAMSYVVIGDGPGNISLSASDANVPWSLIDPLGRVLATGGAPNGTAHIAIPDGLSLLIVGGVEAPAVFRIMGTAAGALIAPLR